VVQRAAMLFEKGEIAARANSIRVRMLLSKINCHLRIVVAVTRHNSPSVGIGNADTNG